jgi:hypothetical protein
MLNRFSVFKSPISADKPHSLAEFWGDQLRGQITQRKVLCVQKMGVE